MEQTRHSAKAKARKHLLKSAGLIGVLTLMSRVMGLVRDIVSAKMFGTSGPWDAFLYAFTVPNFLRRLVGEGALSSAFIPVYIEVLREKGREEADRVAHIVSTLLSLFLGALVLLVLGATALALRVGEFPEKIRLTLSLLQILFPYILFLAHVALSMGILNCHRHFFTPSLSPVILNVVWILGILWVCPIGGDLEARAHLLALTVLFSGVIQLAVQFFPLRGLGYRMRLAYDFYHPALKKIYGLILPAIMGFAVTQVSILIDMTLAFFLGDGANSSLWYGNRLMQFPLGLFGIAMGTALLPSFSEQAAQRDYEDLKETLSFSLRTTFLIVIPASCGLIFLKTPIVRVLFERGNFDAVSTMRTANTVMFYSLGLFAYSGQKMMTSAFYAVQDTKTPFLISSACVLVDIVLNLILMWPLREGGLALATSVSAILNFGLQIFFLEKKVRGLDLGRLAISTLKITVASVLTGLAALWVYSHANFSLGSELADGIAGLSASIASALAIYAVLCALFRVEELGAVWKTFARP
ncbi:MAG: murein biosynthesis integral membrane protein MurJ [Candidatus Omnitrophica bacterium]|nr:murein biosynthesis integral membrane protein MurJ [Candidatus Omnitrophota bacterium]